MSDYCVDNLEADVRKQKAQRNAKNKSRYNFARDLGFDSNESRILMTKSVEVICRIAKERGIEASIIQSIAEDRGIEVSD